MFARWLVSDANPLAARVTANRAWRAFFGAGLMRTSGDFGTQSDPPTHPELLDWLATELVKRGWSMKQLHRLIVTSATYRQSSYLSENLLARDSENRLLARGPRYRVDAEMVRDMSRVLRSKSTRPASRVMRRKWRALSIRSNFSGYKVLARSPCSKRMNPGRLATQSMRKWPRRYGTAM